MKVKFLFSAYFKLFFQNANESLNTYNNLSRITVLRKFDYQNYLKKNEL